MPIRCRLALLTERSGPILLPAWSGFRIQRPQITDEQIKHMVNRFLAWKLPEHFRPDGGISFDPVMNKGTAYESKREPTGTNLFDATQADAMVRHMIDGLPQG